MSTFLENYIDYLMATQNNGASLEQRNLYTKEDYYNLLAPVLEEVNNNKDASLEELRANLFERSGLREAVNSLVYEKDLTPGLVMSYGTMKHQEVIVSGNRQDVDLDNNGTVVPMVEKMTEDTIFDLASVTKIFTSLSILKLLEMGLINLNDSVIKYAPEFINLSGVTIFDLLAFRVPLLTEARIDAVSSREEAERILFNIKINESFNPNSNPYTDMGAMILKYVIEHVTGMSFYDFVNKEILMPNNMIDTHVQIPNEKIYRTVNTNLGGTINKNGDFIMNLSSPKGVVYDPKARVMEQALGNLSGHAGMFSTVGDMTSLARAFIDRKIICREFMDEMGKNRTGRLLTEDKAVQYLGYLCYSKNPILSSSELNHFLSGKAFASAGWLGNQLTVDSLNGIYSFMAASKSHNRVSMVDPSIRPQVELKEDGKTLIKLPNGNTKIDASRFAWEKGTVIDTALMLTMQYKFLEDLMGIELEDDPITRNI